MAEFDKFLTNLDKLEKTSFDSGLTMSTFMLPTKEAVKKYIAQKLPQLKKEEIDLIVDGAEELKKKYDEWESKKEEREEAKRKRKEEQLKKKEERQAKREQEASMTEEEKEKKRKEERDRRKAASKKMRDKFIEQMKKIYEPVLKEIINEVLAIMNQIEIAFKQIQSKVKDIGKKIVQSSITIVTAIPDAVIQLTAIIPNVPGAINSIILVIDSLINLASVLKDLVPLMRPLKYLPLVTDKQKLEGFAKVMNIIIDFVFGALKFIKGIENIIFTLLDALIALLNNLSQSNFKKATKKLKKLGHLKKLQLPLPEEAIDLITNLFWGTKNRGSFYKTDGDPPDDNGELLKLSDDTIVEVYSFSPDDIPEIISLLDQYVVRDNRVVAYRNTINNTDLAGETIKNLRDDLKRTGQFQEPSEAIEVEEFVYDITLPDGTIVYGVSEDAIEFYKSKYTVIINELGAIENLTVGG
jgi:hypothetical protein